MRFCPQCGSPLVQGARFCVQCGATLGDAIQSSGTPQRARPHLGMSFYAVLAVIVATGAVVAMLVLRHQPERQKKVAMMENGTAGRAGLPPGHPKIKLPAAAVRYIAGLEAKARANPKDLKTWDQFGEAASRAALFDPAYYTKAVDAFGHVLKIDPNDLQALRGMGNYFYDHEQFDRAAASYEHYLKEKPNDPDVLTDLGTMYLATGNADQAVAQYHKALAVNPKFLQAYYNLGVAYAEQGRTADAIASLNQALTLAPDDSAKKQIREMIANIQGRTSGGPGGAPSSGASPGSVSTASAALSPPTNFHEAVEQLVRGLPVAGTKVQSVTWVSPLKAEVMMQDFPMQAMPPFARLKLLQQLSSGLKTAKTSFKVTQPVQVDLDDAATGRPMKSVVE